MCCFYIVDMEHIARYKGNNQSTVKANSSMCTQTTKTDRQTDIQTDRERAGTRKEMDAGQKGPRVFRLPQRPLVDTDKCPSGIFSTTGESVSVSC